MSIYDDLELNEETNKFDNMPKRKPNKDLIQIQDIGGITHYSYNVVRYKSYRYDDDVDLEQYGIHGKVIAPDRFVAPETDIKIKMTGKEILMSIYDLAYEINDAPYYEKNHKNKFYVDLIIDWCKKNFHPYDIDLLYNKYKKTLQKGEERLEEPDVIDGTFEVDRFMKDLAAVYQAFNNILAFKDLLEGKAKTAYKLSREGKFFDRISFFDCYESPFWKPNIPLEQRIEIEEDDRDIVTIMQEEKRKEKEILDKYNELPSSKKIAWFRKNALSDKENLYQTMANLIPDIPMHLTYDYKNKGIAMTASINSVFDICWYTMARMLTFYGTSDENRTNNRVYKEKDWYYDDGTIATCLCCGKPFVKTGNRQKYCMDEECQKARKRKNAKDSYNNKLVAKRMHKKSTGK